jgi:hypothetical protein
MRTAIALTLVLLIGNALPLAAKRTRRPQVNPIVENNVRYSAAGDGKTAYVVATDATTDKVLWQAKIFRVHIKPWIEEDNQWVFISGMKLEGNNILLENEESHCYFLEIKTTQVRKTPCQ